jgi:hypothetical protein
VSGYWGRRPERPRASSLPGTTLVGGSVHAVVENVDRGRLPACRDENPVWFVANSSRRPCSARRCADERARSTTRQAPGRAHGELGQLTERCDGSGGLLQTQPDVNRKATLAERAAGVVTKESLGRHFGKPTVDHCLRPLHPWSRIAKQTATGRAGVYVTPSRHRQGRVLPLSRRHCPLDPVSARPRRLASWCPGSRGIRFQGL